MEGKYGFSFPARCTSRDRVLGCVFSSGDFAFRLGRTGSWNWGLAGAGTRVGRADGLKAAPKLKGLSGGDRGAAGLELVKKEVCSRAMAMRREEGTSKGVGGGWVGGDSSEDSARVSGVSAGVSMVGCLVPACT